MAGGALDQIVAKVEAYMGEFLQSRSALLAAKSKLDSAIATAQGSSSNSAQIGTKVFTYPELAALYAENERLLAQNADLQIQIADFKDKVAMVQSGAESVMDWLTPEDAYDTVPPMGGMGAIPVMIPAAALVAAGAVLATTVYFFLSGTKEHLGKIAGEVGSTLILYGGVALLAYWYFIGRKG